MKLQLKSDFRDFYDHMFDREGEVFERYARTDMHRHDAFELLSRAGYKVPPHGTAAALQAVFARTDGIPEGRTDTHPSMPSGWTVVAYDDPLAHCGEGKRLDYLCNLAPETYCSLFMPQETAVSYRELWIGRLWVGLCYQSDDAWRSNVGNVEVVATGMSEGIPRPDVFKDYPLIAVDLIGSMEEGFAVDLNTAPGLDPVRDMIRAGSVLDYIKEFWEARHEPRL